jgi:hypothetical protein
MEARRPAHRSRRLTRPEEHHDRQRRTDRTGPRLRRPETLAEFWAPALGYVSLGTAGAYVALVPDGRPGPKLLLQRVAEAKAGKNRMHFDIEVADPRRGRTPRRPRRHTGQRSTLQRARLHLGHHDRPRGQRVLRLRRRPVRLNHATDRRLRTSVARRSSGYGTCPATARVVTDARSTRRSKNDLRPGSGLVVVPPHEQVRGHLALALDVDRSPMPERVAPA